MSGTCCDRFSGRPRDLRVGIGISARTRRKSLWLGNGIQNALFLAMLLTCVPTVGEVHLVQEGADDPFDDIRDCLALVPVTLVGMCEAAEALDVMIDLDAQLDPEWIVAFRERGGKLVSMRFDHDYVCDIEQMIFGRLPNAPIVPGAYHEIWTLPQYAASGIPYLGSVCRVPIRVVPPLWNPIWLQHKTALLPDGRQFGYQPGRRRWRVGIFEPNSSVVTTSLIPLLTCEAAHRTDSGMFERVRAFSTFEWRQHPGFQNLVCSLDVVRHGLASFDHPVSFHEVMAGDVDAVVSHQWECGLSSLYCEALYGGYPLIHNSALIGGCGYRYQAFDCVEGARVLCQAIADHDSSLEAYRQRAATFLKSLDPACEANVNAYSGALTAVVASHGSSGA